MCGPQLGGIMKAAASMLPPGAGQAPQSVPAASGAPPPAAGAQSSRTPDYGMFASRLFGGGRRGGAASAGGASPGALGGATLLGQ